VIEVQDLVCGWPGRRVLDKVGFRAEPGVMTGVLGPNGSGKTTLLMALAGLLAPESGSIRVFGRDPGRLRPRERALRLGSVPQKREDPEGFMAGEVVLMGRYAHLGFLGVYGPGDHAAARAAMDKTRTLPLAGRELSTLSGGEAQRVRIARALAQEAGALLLDEASQGLDAARKVEVFDVLAGMAAAGKLVLAAIHDLNLAALYCRELVFLKQGRVAARGRVEEVFTREVLGQVYGTHIEVVAHPATGAPQALLVPGSAAPAVGGGRRGG
jgi:iron complex transport system ATP-binding protein